MNRIIPPRNFKMFLVFLLNKLCIPISLVLVIGVFNLSQASASARCENLYLNENRSTDRSLKSFEQVNEQVEALDLPRLKERIAEIFNDPNASSSAKNQRAFEIYLEQRLECFESSLQVSILEIISKLSFEHQTDPNGGYNYKHKGIIIRIPEKHIGSILDFALRVHEAEHLIQDFQMKDWKLHESDLKQSHYVYSIFNAEKGAMLAEGTFLLALPYDLIIRDLESMAQESGGNYRKMVSGLMRSSSPTEYVQHQWELNRYSKERLKERYFSDLITSLTTLSITGGISIYILFTSIHSYFGF